MAKEQCEWTEDPVDGCYLTKCGKSFWLNEGTWKQNGMVFCPYCGKQIAEVE